MIDAVVELVVEAAERLILPRYQSLTAGQIRTKSGPHDLVTIADEEAERWLTPRLSALLPGSVVVGEEAVATDPGALSRLLGAAPVWLIDPVDGTLNFAEGRPDFCVMVALVQGGIIESGVIYEPLKGRCCIARRGAGAWLRSLPDGIDHPLPGPATGRVSELTGFAYHRPLKGRSVAVSHRRLGSAGVEYVRLAMGLDAFSLYDRNMPWDHAAGSLLLTETGGRVAHVDGSDYRPGPSPGPPLLTASAVTWAKVRSALGMEA
ncbi:MAG: fructose-1,6-bisphosphatase/inositol monophosphatase family enzyme [Myxococcota bacterium]|jgi:fructose-1,6-bisphosphatase/inositol monophosphatase family enzyme